MPPRVQYIWSVYKFNRHPGLAEQPFGQLVRIIFSQADPVDPGVDEHLGTDNTREMGTVERSPFDGHSVQGRLNDGILLSMKATAEFVPFPGRNI